MDSETMPTPPRRSGRPRVYAKRATIVAAVAARGGRGESLNSIFADQEAGIPSRAQFLNWLAQDPDLSEAYHVARKMHAQRWDPLAGR